MLSEQQQRIMGYFIEEAKDHLNTIEQGLVNLQSTITDSEMVHEVFRAAHSVKGGAAMLGLNSIQHTAHRLEDYFKVLKECPQVHVDQKLETLFLRVYDTLQDQVDHLQGPFGLTDDKAQEAMAIVEPVFAELNQHLIWLVNQAGVTPPDDVEFIPATVAQPAVSQPPVPQPAAAKAAEATEASALQFIFQSDVPAQLRAMLQLFKQPESAATREQLQDLCRVLSQPGEQFHLANWCELLETAEQAIANPDNTYRTLAPVIIKDIKRSQESVLSGRLTEIFVSEDLLNLLPLEPEIEADLDSEFTDLLGAMNSDDQDAGFLASDDFADDFAIGPDPSFAETSAIAETDWFTEIPTEDDLGKTVLQNGHEAELNFELGFEQISSAASHPGDLDLSFIDRLDDHPLPAEMSERNGPQVGAAELNSLADLFEGELPDLGMTWQEEEVVSLTASHPLESPESTGDFFDLLDQDNSDSLVLDEAQEDDLSGLLNAATQSSDRAEALSWQSSTNATPELQDDLPLGFEPPGLAAPDEIAMFFQTDQPPDETAAVSQDLSQNLSQNAGSQSISQNGKPDSASGFQNLDQLFAGIEVDDFSADSAVSDTSIADLPTSLDPIESLPDIIELPNPSLEADLADLFTSESAPPETALSTSIESELEPFSLFSLDDSAPEISSVMPSEAFPPVDPFITELPPSAEISFAAEPEAIEDQLFSNHPEASLTPEQESLPEFWMDESENVALAEQNDESIAESPQTLKDTPDDFNLEEDLEESLEENPEESSIAVENLTHTLELFAVENLDHTLEDVSSEPLSSYYDALDNLLADESLGEVENTANRVALPALDESINGFAATDSAAGEFNFDAFLTEVASDSDLSEMAEFSPFEATPVSELTFEQPVAFPETENPESEHIDEIDEAAVMFGFDAFENASESLLEPIDESSVDFFEDESVDLNVNSTDGSEDETIDWGDLNADLNIDLTEGSVDESVDLSNDLEFLEFTDQLTEALLEPEAVELTIDAEINSEVNSDINPYTSLVSKSEDMDFNLFSLEGNGALTESEFIEIAAEEIAAEGELELEPSVEPELSALEPIDAISQEDFADLECILAEDSAMATNAEPVAAIAALDDEFDEFADLEMMLGDELPQPSAAIAATNPIATDDFADLEALLGDESPLPSPAEPDPAALAALARNDDEFGDLEALLQDTDQKLGVGSSPMRNVNSSATRRPTRRNVIADQTMRVSVKHLDNLNNLVGEMVVNRNSLEQTQERLRQFLDNLLYQVQQLSDVGQRMRDLYERSLLESSLMASRRSYQLSGSSNNSAQTSHATGVSFDALEMDKFTGFHTLSQEMIELIVRVRESASDIDFVVEESDQVTRNFRQITTQLQEGLTRSRMVPFAQTADRLPRGVRDNAIKYGKQAELQIEGRDTLIDKMIVEQLYDPMTHLVNNAIAHGIETSQERIAAGKSVAGRIVIRAFHQGNQTVISVSDDGAGINTDAVKAKAVAKRLITAAEAEQMSRLEAYDLLFHHGFSTADTIDDLRGRGVGLDVVRNNLSEIRGAISIDSTIGKGSTFTIRLPLTLSISKALCCISNRARIAFPMDGVEDMLDVPKERVYMDEQGHACIQWRDTLLPFQPLSDLLKYSRILGRGSVYGGSQEDDMLSIVVLRSAGNYLALQVDQVLGEQEIVIKQLEGPVPKPIGVAGATVLGDGRIMPIADVLELIDLSQGRIRREAGNALWETSGDQLAQDTAALKTDPTVLIVDDSITVRELLSMTFNKVGYRVEQARDGQEAWEKLRSGLPCDLVFCDIEMPRMDGLELLSRLQKDANLCHIPIAMLTSRGADRHRQMAVQLGAKGYFTKPYLEEMLLDAAQRMLKGEVLVTSAGG